MLVAHACNTSYSGSRDQEDCGLKPSWETLSQKKTKHKNQKKKKKNHKKGLME
jgi:hypothetical protein